MTVDEDVHAGPAVRKMARELGVDLRRVNGSGPRHRILKDDLGGYIKDMVGRAQRGGAGKTIESAPLPDFSQFGEISVQPIERIHLLTAQGMLNSWAAAPQVTQFDEADITELEQFRKVEKATAERLGIKLTLLPFLLKACACALRELPQFNVSIDMARQQLIRKHYIHIGVAVDTRHGLFVPVLRDVDRKSVFELAQEIQDKAVRAAEKKLKPAEMQGGCFSISSLGSIGGTAFTPIVNVPEVAILGVSKARLQPVWSGDRFEPRLMLPLSLSYDHRAVNGADGAKFTTLLGWLLSDLRRLLLGAGSGVTGL
jgi:pyruvate dehydrogenase E2 component (dihydrolipoamide acetyltransferase)